MNAKTPTIRQTAWISVIPQLGVMGLIILIWWQINPDKAVINGAITYLIISFSLRRIVARDHRKGMQLVKTQNFETAIPFFEKSYDFFSRNDWIDKYRYLTLLSSSRISYKEMALNNIAFCFGQLGNGQKAKEYYERTLSEFPDSGLATAGLNMLNSMNKKETE